MIEAMTTMQIRVEDDLKTRLATRAAESGYTSVEAYIEALLRADAGEDSVVNDRQLEDLLISRLDSGPSVDCTPDFVRQFKSEVAKRRVDRGRNS